MKSTIQFWVVLALFLTTLSIALAQSQFTLGQTNAVSGGVSSGGVYTVRDTLGELAVGSARGGSYQVIGGTVNATFTDASGTTHLYLPAVRR
jgi:hypothetical protein